MGRPRKPCTAWGPRSRSGLTRVHHSSVTRPAAIEVDNSDLCDPVVKASEKTSCFGVYDCEVGRVLHSVTSSGTLLEQRSAILAAEPSGARRHPQRSRAGSSSVPSQPIVRRASGEAETLRELPTPLERREGDPSATFGGHRDRPGWIPPTGYAANQAAQSACCQRCSSTESSYSLLRSNTSVKVSMRLKLAQSNKPCGSSTPAASDNRAMMSVAAPPTM